MRGRREMRIAETAAAAAHQQHMLLSRNEVRDQISALYVKDCRAWRHANHQVAPSLAVRRFVPALTSVACNISPLDLKVPQGRLSCINRNVDAAAAAAVAAIRTPTRHMRLTTHR